LAAEEAVHTSALSEEIKQHLSISLKLEIMEGYIAKDEMVDLVNDYLDQQLLNAKGMLSAAEKQVLEEVLANVHLSKSPEEDEPLTRGQRMADAISKFGGSWLFIGCFFAFLFIWISLNVFAFVGQFDPYPFILLNLLLSCVAALQAPIIMMSQNRKEEKDRLRSINDYKINLQAELEIRDLQVKLDRTLALLEAMQSE
jgi:uncharacterized membrane protein